MLFFNVFLSKGSTIISLYFKRLLQQQKINFGNQALYFEIHLTSIKIKISLNFYYSLTLLNLFLELIDS